MDRSQKAESVASLNAVFNEALRDPEVMKRMGELAIEPIQSTRRSFEAMDEGRKFSLRNKGTIT